MKIICNLPLNDFKLNSKSPAINGNLYSMFLMVKVL